MVMIKYCIPFVVTAVASLMLVKSTEPDKVDVFVINNYEDRRVLTVACGPDEMGTFPSKKLGRHDCYDGHIDKFSEDTAYFCIVDCQPENSETPRFHFTVLQTEEDLTACKRDGERVRCFLRLQEDGIKIFSHSRRRYEPMYKRDNNGYLVKIVI